MELSEKDFHCHAVIVPCRRLSFSALKEKVPVVLRVPHWFWGHGTTFEEWIKGGSEEFEKQNPNVKIDGYQVPYDQYSG